MPRNTKGGEMVQKIKDEDFRKSGETRFDTAESSENFLQDIFDTIGDGITAFDTELNVIKTSGWMREMFSSRMPLEGNKCYRLFHDRESPCQDCPVLRAIETGEKQTKITEYPSALDQEGWVELSAFPRKNDSGDIVGVVEYAKDITTIKRTEEALRGSEEKLRSTLESSPDSIIVIDLQGRIADCNRATLNLFGVSSKEDLIGKDGFEFFPDEGKDRARSYMRKILENGKIRNIECSLNSPSGRNVTVEISASLIRDSSGNPIALVATAKDISERKEAERQLSFQAMLLDQIRDKVTATDLEGRITYVNQAQCRTFGRSPDELVGMHVEYFGEDPSRGATQKEIIEATRARGQWRGEVVNKRDDGMEMIVDCRTWLVRDKDERPVGMVGLATDITERKRIEEERESILRELKFITDNVVEVSRMDDIDEMCRFIAEAVHSVNPQSYVLVSLYDPVRGVIRIRVMLGFEKFSDQINELVGGDPKDITTNPDELMEKAFDFATGKLERMPGGVYDLMNRKVNKDTCKKFEELLGVKESYTVVITTGGRPMGEISILTTNRQGVSYKSAIETLASHFSVLLQRKQAKVALKEKEELLINVLESMREGILVLDNEFRYTYWNRGMERISNFTKDEVLGKRPWEIFPFLEGNIRMAMEGAMKGEVRMDTELEYSLTDGKGGWTLESYYPLRDADGNISGIVGVIDDITEKKQGEEEKAKLERQLYHAQKLETIGTLAGGIAHDFNNILTPILGYTDMALSSLPESNPIYRDLEEIFRGANRARELVKQILTFSRQAESEQRPLSLNVIVNEALKLLRPSIPASIEIHRIIDPSCGRIMADATQMHQLIVNLCTNAFQAMEDEGGVMTIELKQIKADSGMAHYHLGLKEGLEYLRLSVSDTGKGMSAETMARVFEPFFTTKDVGKGTGMGLSIVHGIVRSHKGDISVSSSEGEGSIFRVYLPVMPEETGKGEENIESMPRGSESILVVDDDELVSGVLRKILQRLGYRVEVENSSVEALGRFRRDPDAYDLVITDLTMPNMTGNSLARRLREHDSDLPVILITGYGESIPRDSGDASPVNGVIAKPVRMRNLAFKVREVLDS